jgi:hypothetical protein
VPKKTAVTPSTEKREDARGEGLGGERVERGERYSMKGAEKDSGRTRWLGLNLRAYILINICSWWLIRRNGHLHWGSPLFG